MPACQRARRQAEVLVPLLDEPGLPPWFSYSIEGDATRAGQPLRDAYEMFDFNAYQAKVTRRIAVVTLSTVG